MCRSTPKLKRAGCWRRSNRPVQIGRLPEPEIRVVLKRAANWLGPVAIEPVTRQIDLVGGVFHDRRKFPAVDDPAGRPPRQKIKEHDRGDARCDFEFAHGLISRYDASRLVFWSSLT